MLWNAKSVERRERKREGKNERGREEMRRWGGKKEKMQRKTGKFSKK